MVFLFFFMVPGWFFIFHVENTLKLYSGPTIQSRPCLWPSDNKFSKISSAKTKRQKIFVQVEKNGDLRLQQILHLIKVSFPIS